jgi:hypothetical protein
MIWMRYSKKERQKQIEKTKKMERAFNKYILEPTKINKTNWYDILRGVDISANQN